MRPIILLKPRRIQEKKANRMTNLASLPPLGVGLGYRHALRAETFWHRVKIDVLELTAEEFLAGGDSSRTRQALTPLVSSFPLLLHGIELSLGSDAPLDETYLTGFASLARTVNAPWVSEHLSFTRAGSVEIGHLTPIPPTWEAVEVVVRNVRTLQARLDVPVLLENITRVIDLPGDMTEWEFVGEVLERTDAGLLLDVTNLYTNAVNSDLDPWDELRAVPMERAVEIHLAGGQEGEGYLVDSHSAAIAPPVWELAEAALKRADIKAVIIERDTNFGAFGDLLEELERARSLWRTAGAARVPA